MKRKTIMLVEDNPDDVKLTLRAFKKHNILNEVVVAHDGVAALEYLSAATEPPAFILLDIKLPRLDGLEVLKRIRADARWRLLPVVILTSSKEEQDIINGYGSGANSYIRKPVDFDQFTEAIRQLGVYWLLMNEPPPTEIKHTIRQDGPASIKAFPDSNGQPRNLL